MADAPDAAPEFVPRTRRQQLAMLLRRKTLGFDELRLEMQVTVRELCDDLRHVERSARGAGARLDVEPARCGACGYVFRGRAPRRFHPPSRCSRCRSEWILEPRFHLRDAGGSR